MNHERNPLFSAINNATETENGHVAFKSTLNACLDFFYKSPLVTDLYKLSDLFSKAYRENPQVAIQLAFWLRDPRQGAGRRTNGRAIFANLNCLEGSDEETFTRIAQYGRFDDLMHYARPLTREISQWWVEAAQENQLAAKWLPRESGSNRKLARQIAKHCGMSLKEYRKYCTRHTKVVETQMCNSQWDQINYAHVPSQAFRKSRKAFERNDGERFEAFLGAVEAGEETVNAGAVYPHEVILETMRENFHSWNSDRLHEVRAEEAQWKSLPNFFPEGICSTMVVADTSASMCSGSASVDPIHIALSLALYCAERIGGIWKDHFISFSRVAKLQYVDSSKTVAQRIQGIESIVEDTNLYSVFKLILSTAKRNRLQNHQLPRQLLIISDMQFNQGCRGLSSLDEIREMYSQAGYTMPNIVYWNVNGDSNVPVTINSHGAALISGYSPSLLKSLFAEELTPHGVMFEAIKDYPTRWRS